MNNSVEQGPKESRLNAADKTPKQPQPGLRERVYAGLYRVRRRIATALGVLLAMFLAYHVVFGRNGLNNYEQKRAQNRQLQKQIQTLQQQNQHLKQHNGELKSDPDAIEFEARQKLHYAKPGEVIYRLSDQPQTTSGDAPAPARNAK